MRLLRGLGELIENIVLDVVSYRHVPYELILSRQPAWLFAQFERVQRANWDEFNQAILVAETGTARALARAFSKERLPDLQDYDEMMASKSAEPKRLSAWVEKYKEANTDRHIA